MKANRQSVLDESKALHDEIMAKLDRATPFLDKGQTEGWPPSTKLKTLWLMAVSYLDAQIYGTPGQVNAAIDRVNRTMNTVEEYLETARQRYREGFHANPYGDPVKRS